jgi:hypothetical protein
MKDRSLPLGCIRLNTIKRILMVFSESCPNIFRAAMPNMCAAARSTGHLLGNLWSPSLMGWVIDRFGQAAFMVAGFDQILATLGALPVAQPGPDPAKLTAGILAALPALVISGAVFLAGASQLPRELVPMRA